MLIRHSVIYFIGKLAPAILSLIGIIIYTRIVDPEIYGLFSLITVISGLINILFFQWIRSSFIRFYNDRENINSFIPSIIKSHFLTLGILLCPTLIIAMVFYINSIDLKFILVGYTIVVFLSIFEMGVIYFRTILKPSIVVNANFLKALLVIPFSVFFIYLGFDVWGLLLGSIMGTIVGLLFFITKLPKRNLSILVDKPNRRAQINFLKYGLPITLSFVLSVALQNIDKIMISSILGLESNGNYAVGYDLMHNLIYMIMTSLSLAGFPIILKVIKKKGQTYGKKQFQSYVNLLLFISVPACFGLVGILKEFTSIIIGESYAISDELLILIIIASFFHGLKSYYFDLTLQISTKTKYFFIPVLIAIIINIIFNYYLLNRYGIEGAAFATVLAFLIAMLISAYYSFKNYHVPFPWREFLKIVFSSYVMYFLITLITVESNIGSMLAKIIIGTLVYGIVSVIVNSIQIRDMFVYKILKR